MPFCVNDAYLTEMESTAMYCAMRPDNPDGLPYRRFKIRYNFYGVKTQVVQYFKYLLEDDKLR